MAKNSWGGPWTEEKLDAFEKYVKAYLRIMNRQRDLYDWKLLYFDGFAGSGIRSESEADAEIQSIKDLFSEDVSWQDLDVYKGAAERVVRIEQDGLRSFDAFYFIDKSQENCDALSKKLSDYKVNGKRYYLPVDANIAVCQLANTLKGNRKFKALAFLDPFGMQIDWDALKTLKGVSVDLWILVPTGVIVNRLLERKMDVRRGLAHSEKLCSFFGLPEDFLQDYFYIKTQEDTLFGEEETVVTKAKDSIWKIAELYVERLKTIFPYVSEDPLILFNNHNFPIYHLVFASQKAVAQKIAQQIIKSNG